MKLIVIGLVIVAAVAVAGFLLWIPSSKLKVDAVASEDNQHVVMGHNSKVKYELSCADAEGRRCFIPRVGEVYGITVWNDGEDLSFNAQAGNQLVWTIKKAQTR